MAVEQNNSEFKPSKAKFALCAAAGLALSGAIMVGAKAAYDVAHPDKMKEDLARKREEELYGRDPHDIHPVELVAALAVVPPVAIGALAGKAVSEVAQVAYRAGKKVWDDVNSWQEQDRLIDQDPL